MPRKLAFQPSDVVTYLRRTRRLREIAVGMVTDSIIADTAREWGVTVTDAELQQAANRFRAANGLADPAATTAWLEAGDWSRADFEEFLEREVLSAKLPAKLFAEKGAAYLASNTEAFTRVRFHRMTLTTDGAAKEMLMQLMHDGADFAALAAAQAGPAAGQPQTLFRGVLLKPVGDQLFAAKPGALVGPVAVADGFNLYKVVEQLPADLADPATAVEVRRQLFEAWINSQLDGMQVDLAGLRPSLAAPVSLGAPVKLS